MIYFNLICFIIGMSVFISIIYDVFKKNIDVKLHKLLILILANGFWFISLLYIIVNL